LIDQFDVIEARHGHKAIRFADFKKPDLIIIDIELPGLTGIDVCKRLKATNHTKNIPSFLFLLIHEKNKSSLVFKRGLMTTSQNLLTLSKFLAGLTHI
jgi:two-component system sensor histidine kinase/response regulator